jgi:uncharacterized protein (DUF3084 family)
MTQKELTGEVKRLRLELESANCEHRAKVFAERGDEIKRLQTEVASVRETWQQEITIREDMFRQSQTEIERLQALCDQRGKRVGESRREYGRLEAELAAVTADYEKHVENLDHAMDGEVKRLRLQRDVLALNGLAKGSPVLVIVADDGEVVDVVWPTNQTASETSVKLPKYSEAAKESNA